MPKNAAAAEKRDSITKESGDVEKIPYRARNYILFASGLLVIVAGWFLLRAGHITLAPIMLVLGYCGILPLAIILK